MGFTGLARWVNAPTTGLDLIRENIIRNHNGRPMGPWRLTVKSYRSSLPAVPAMHVRPDRNICALTMGENVFVLVEDPAAPTKAEHLSMLSPGGSVPAHAPRPPHYRNTFLTLRPPDALDQILTQLKVNTPIRQTSSTSAQRGQPTVHQGQQLIIDGQVFAIGNEWLVRVGNVILAGGAIKGMLLEAEYLPLPVLNSNSIDGTSEFLSNLLTSLLPNIRDAKTMAVTISDSQWEEVLWDWEEGDPHAIAKDDKREEVDSVYFSADQEPATQRGDWVGVDRDRRASFLIIGALKSEGIL